MEEESSWPEETGRDQEGPGEARRGQEKPGQAIRGPGEARRERPRTDRPTDLPTDRPTALEGRCARIIELLCKNVGGVPFYAHKKRVSVRIRFKNV